MTKKAWLISLITLASFHSSGCAASSAADDKGRVAVEGSERDGGRVASEASGDDGSRCPWGCPATWIEVSLAVVPAADAGPVTGVDVTLSGATSGTMPCMPNGTAMICTWPPSQAVTPGSYSLQITATGFQTSNVSAQVAVTTSCGCEWGALEPSMVTLNPS